MIMMIVSSSWPCLEFNVMVSLDIMFQGLMFGYATDETEDLMPLTVILAHKLNYRMGVLRRSGEVKWIRPDSKTQVISSKLKFELKFSSHCVMLQVTVQYKMDGGAVVPIRVHTVVISVQHSPDVTPEQMDKDLKEHVIKVTHPTCNFRIISSHSTCILQPVIPSKYLDDKTIYHLQPSGSFITGGPKVMKL